jgi:hypothetical protein
MSDLGNSIRLGDTVLILGINERQDSLRDGALIAGLSPFGVLPSDPSQQMRWIFDNIPLGDAQADSIPQPSYVRFSEGRRHTRYDRLRWPLADLRQRNSD